jgi:hypothetical protein
VAWLKRALIRRINRVLAKENKVLRLCRYNSQGFSNLGRYYQVDLITNLGGWWFDRASELEAYAREIQVMAPSEYLAI